MDENKIRLQKFFTDSGIMSRRAAEAEISAGHVLVNGSAAEIGMKINPLSDTVEFNGKIIKYTPDKPFVYIMLNKPRGYVTTLNDEKGRPTAASLITDVGERVYPVGRLDMNSDGLLLFTDDGELTNYLTHPRHEIPKFYIVKVEGKVENEQLRTLGGEMTLDGYRIKPVEITVYAENHRSTTLSFTLYEGRNRQIRKMCEQVGLRVLSLTRTAVGEILLGDLPRGKWRPLTADEIRYLKSGINSNT